MASPSQIRKLALKCSHVPVCRRRHIFSLPSFSPFPDNGSKPQTYHERKVLPYTREELYDVVADVASYPRFVPFCTGARIMTPPAPKGGSPSVKQLEAELTVGFLSFKESYVSKVVCTPYESVEATASSSSPLFKSLTTTWRFHELPSQLANAPRRDPPLSGPRNPDVAQLSGPESTLASRKHPGTLVTLDLAYAFANPLHATVSVTFFGQVSKLMVDAFQRRCMEVYGHS